MDSHKPLFFQIDSHQYVMAHYSIPQPEGWEAPVNFPNCCDFHKSIVQITKTFLAKFPNCCNEHIEFNKRFPVSKGQYDYIIEKIVYVHHFTEHLIGQKINNDDWLEDIIDYIEYVNMSFGHPGIGAEIYLNNLSSIINNLIVNKLT